MKGITARLMTVSFIAAIAFAALLIAACVPEDKAKPPSKTPPDTSKFIELEATQELKKFSSVQEIRDFLRSAAVSRYTGYAPSAPFLEERTLTTAVGAPLPAVTKAAVDVGGAASRAVDYSTTNIQVAGVDEADFVKNDGKYIYVLTQDKLVIVEAFPAEDADILSTTKIEGRPRDLFINKDRLVVFTEKQDEVYAISQYDFVPRPRATMRTHALVYDISDRKNPELVKDYNINGNYFQSRMIGEYVYFISQENVYYTYYDVEIPVVWETARSPRIVIRPDV